MTAGPRRGDIRSPAPWPSAFVRDHPVRWPGETPGRPAFELPVRNRPVSNERVRARRAGEIRRGAPLNDGLWNVRKASFVEPSPHGPPICAGRCCSCGRSAVALATAGPASAAPLWPGGPEVPSVQELIEGLTPPGVTPPQLPPQLAPEPAAPFSAPSVNPSNGETVGVAQPIIIRFNEAVGDRAAAERAIRITTQPPVDGTSTGRRTRRSAGSRSSSGPRTPR